MIKRGSIDDSDLSGSDASNSVHGVAKVGRNCDCGVLA